MSEEAADASDLTIIRALVRDGRMANHELAQVTGLSASQCSRRRARLERDGLILGYRAVVSPRLLGEDIIALVNVTLSRHSRENARQFRRHVERLEQVIECFAVTGEADYQLKLGVRSLEELSSVLNDELLQTDFVQQVRSSVVLETVKSRR